MPDNKTLRALKALIALTEAGTLKWKGDIGSCEFNAEAGGGTIVVRRFTEQQDGPAHPGGIRYKLAVSVGGTVVVDFVGANELWAAIITAKENGKFDPWIASLEGLLEKT